MYYLEEHLIKKVSNILNVNHKDLIKSKIEIKKSLILLTSLIYQLC